MGPAPPNPSASRVTDQRRVTLLAENNPAATLTMLDISVVICTYTESRLKTVLATVTSVRQQSYACREIILVVDHNQALLNQLKQALPDASVVPNASARGLSGARNTGLRLAQGAIVAFIDDDAVASFDWLRCLASHYAVDSVIAVGGAIKPRWEGGTARWFPEEFYWVFGCTYRGMPSQAAPVRNLIGCNMSFRKAAFAAIGEFYEGIGRTATQPLGCEETELCIRARQRLPGSEIIFDPICLVYHLVPQSRVSWRYLCSRCFSEGLSKARVTRLIGAGDGTASERHYALRTLPAGLLRGVFDALLRRDNAGLARALAIVVGFSCTVCGYVVGLSITR